MKNFLQKNSFVLKNIRILKSMDSDKVTCFKITVTYSSCLQPLVNN